MKLKRLYCLAAGILLFHTFLAAENPLVNAFPGPGSYSRDQAVALSAPGYGIFYTFAGGNSVPDIPYREPLYLSALEGEEREYGIRISLVPQGGASPAAPGTVGTAGAGVGLGAGGVPAGVTLSYVIDKKSPRSPEPSLPAGGYSGTQTVTLKAEAGMTYFSVGGDMDVPLSLWQGREIVLAGEAGKVRTYHLSAYTQDPAGNRSPIKNWVYTVQQDQELPGVNLEIASPVAGTFANPQLLYLRQEGYSWIRYSTNGSDPTLMGTLYTGPAVLPAVGDITLKLAAMPANSRRAEYYEVSYRVLADAPRLNLPPSGIYTSSMPLSLPGEGRYSFGDKTPAFPDPALPGEIQIREVPQGVREFPLRILAKAGGREYEHRYFYILDSRQPPAPRIITADSPPLAESTRVEITGAGYSTIHYTLDGSSPNSNSPVYRDSFVLGLPLEPESGSVIIKAIAYGQNGNSSPEASLLLTYQRAVPPPPTVTLEQPDIYAGAVIRAAAADPGHRLVYRISPDVPGGPPDKTSPEFPGEVYLDVPAGQDRTFYLSFASRNAAGRLSEEPREIAVRINRRNTAAPAIRFEGGQVTLVGPAPLFYQVDELPAEEGQDRQTRTPARGYDLPFRLVQGEEPRNLEILAWSDDSVGGKSEISRLQVSLPGRIPAVPEYFGTVPGAQLSLDSQIIYLRPVPEGHEIRYTVSRNDEVPPEVTGDSPLAGDSLVFRGSPGEETVFHLRLRARNRYTGELSPEVRLDFTLDTRAPVIPALSGPSQGGYYYGEIPLIFPASYPEKLYIALAEGPADPGDPFSPGGFLFFQDISFSAPPGESRRFSLRLGAQDAAGNRTVDSRVISFTVDNTFPPLPVLAGLPENGIGSRETRILPVFPASFPPEEMTASGTASGSEAGLGGQGIAVHYEISRDGRPPKAVDRNSPVLTSQGILQGPEPAGSKTVMIRYRAVNPRGIWSREEGLVSFILEKSDPLRPELPGVNWLDGERILLSWNVPAGLTLYYRIREDGGEFREFTGPVPFTFSKNRTTLSVEFYYRDGSGSTGEAGNYTISSEPERRELVRGYPSGATNAIVRLVKTQNDRNLRYEISGDGRLPEPVSLFSPAFPQNLIIDLPPGDRGDFIVRVRAYDPVKREMDGGEQIIRFTLDKTRPNLPELTGIEDGENYQDDLWIGFAQSEEDIYFSVLKEGSPPAEENFQLYTRPERIQSAEGRYESYRILAYKQNAAGNRSDLREWKFAIDRQIIYVALRGSDENDGTRGRPFATLERAVRHSQTTGRGTVYLARGDYILDSPLALPKELNIFGGMDPQTWAYIPGAKSAIKAGPDFSSEHSLIRTAGNGSLTDIILEQEGARTESLFRQDGGSWKWSRVELNLKGGRAAHGAVITSGQLVLDNSRLTGDGHDGDSLLRIRGASVTAVNSTLERVNTRENSLVIFQEGGELRLENSSVLPGSGRNTTGLSVAGGKAWAGLDTVIETGAGTLGALGVLVKDGGFSLVKGVVRGGGARIVRGIHGENSELLIQDSVFRLDGSGSMALQAAGCPYLILGNLFQATGREFVYLIRLENSSGRGYNNYIRTGGTQDLQGISVAGQSSSWYHNTMIFSPAEKSARGFISRDRGEFNFFNNIIINTGGGNGGTAVTASSREARLQGNSFYGWETVFSRAGGTGETGRTSAAAKTAAELNGLDGNPQGGAFHQNREEAPQRSFTDPSGETPKLRGDSANVNGGIDLSRIFSDLTDDWEKQKRPNPNWGTVPAYDTGADEYWP